MSADNTAAKPPPQQQSSDFYAKRIKIQPKDVKGRFARLRLLAMVVLLGLYYILPWLNWNGRQIVLFDLPARQFHILGWTFWPQDFFYLALLLIIAAYSLFFFTALAGRLWCGYACPQTVWTEIFMLMERWVEGDRNKRIKLDKAPWSGRKLLLRSSKHALWIVFALWTGFTFVGYFTPIEELGVRLLQFDLGGWETFWVLFYSFATYGNAGFMREQVCIYMCPYARFQSAMFDRNTLIISYDEERGEPRGSRKRNTDAAARGQGDCIDCTLCVQVCPTGIDIRNGLQYQCIGCAACVDACDEVMDKMGTPRGLVRYTTENALKHNDTRVLRPRVFVYAGLLLVLLIGLAYAVSQRTPLELDVIRDRNALYKRTNEGLVENVYTLKLVNMTDHGRLFRITLDGLTGMKLINDQGEVFVESGEVYNLPLRVTIDPVQLERTSTEITFTLEAVDDPQLYNEAKARFLGPTGY